MRPKITPRVAISIGVVLGWLIFALRYNAYYASTFFLTGLTMLALTWISYVIEFAKTRKRAT
jgi:hypothetical protein